MQKHLILTLFGLLCLVHHAQAQMIQGTGYGLTLNEAKKEALAELSQNIHVNVKSEFSSSTTQRGSALDEMKKKTLLLKSDLPILGATFSEVTIGDEVMVNAILNASAKPLYEKELAKITDMITANLKHSETKISHQAKVSTYQSILTQIEQYYKMRIVAQFLSCSQIPQCPVTAADIKGRLLAIEKKADTLTFGAKILARNFTEHTVFIYPPTPVQSNEVTQFSRAVKNHLAAQLTTASSPDKADAFITGTYTILKSGIELTCHLTEKDGNTLKTGLVFFLPQAYAGYETEPLALSFEKLIQAGYVVSGGFRVDIKTKKGRSDLLYTHGQAMSLMVKMNKPGYFYLVSHNFKANGTYSYVINFTEEHGNRKFVYYVGGDAVNKWMELGEFTVVPPFGVETLQMMASTEDLVNKVPNTYYDPVTQLYTIGSAKKGKTPTASKPEDAVVATRGLIMKKKSETAEATLTFTSMKAK